MTDEKSVLVIGLDPTLIDFSEPGYAAGMDATKVLAGLKSSEDELTRLGYNVQMCLTTLAKLRRQLFKANSNRSGSIASLSGQVYERTQATSCCLRS